MKFLWVFIFVLVSSQTQAKECAPTAPVTKNEMEWFRKTAFPDQVQYKDFYSQLLDLGLTLDEANALQYYKQNGYTGMNRVLLNPKGLDDAVFAGNCAANKLLYRGLQKLPSVRGELFRGIREGSPGNIDSVKKGGYWVNKAFMSISKKESIAHSFGTFFIHVRTLTCKDVSWNAKINFMAEKEVICLPGTVFKVSAISDQEIIAQEVSKIPNSLWIRIKRKFQKLINDLVYFD